MVRSLGPVLTGDADKFSKVIAINRDFNPIFLTRMAMCDRIEITLRKVVNFSQHKHLFNLTGKDAVARLIIFFLVFALFQLKASGQVEKPVTKPELKPTRENQTKPVAADTSKVQKDSVKTKKGDIESTILYTAQDSIISSLDTKIVRLYGNAKVTYGKI